MAYWEGVEGCRVSFFGRMGEVTGSCHLIECGQTRVLLDCGLFQGRPEVEALNAEPFPFAPANIDRVILSHAHLDHSGLLPKLVREGFRGPIYATAPTCELAQALWMDAINVQEARGAPELYSADDVGATCRLLHPVAYGETCRLPGGLVMCLRDAGHILGSAIVELRVRYGKKQAAVVFSGDLGNPDAALMPPMHAVHRADAVILESTYGDREHAPMQQTLDELADIVQQTHRDGGNVVIPCFAVARTQELLFRLGELYRQDKLPQLAVFLDSPLAVQATQIYERHLDWLAEADRGALRRSGVSTFRGWLPPLRYTRTTEESKRISGVRGGAIILAGSGMCTGGRILHHLRRHLGERRHRVVLVGFQAPDTLGRALQEGARTAALFGETQPVAASVHHLEGFSAHAGQRRLVDWLTGLAQEPALYLVHGEMPAMTALQAAFMTARGWHAIVAERGVPHALV